MRFKIEKLNGYQILPTEFLKDKKLGLKTKGLLTIMYSLPNDWDYTMQGLCTVTGEGITAIRNCVTELELNGYLTRKQTRNEKGKFEYIYIVRTKKIKVKIEENVLQIKRFKEHYRI